MSFRVKAKSKTIPAHDAYRHRPEDMPTIYQIKYIYYAFANGPVVYVASVSLPSSGCKILSSCTPRET